MVASHLLPLWVEGLLTHKFFNACVSHEDVKRNEKNVYCFDCCISLCPHCLHPHSSHRLLQIRRYMYNDVIRLDDDAHRLFDSASVQPYIINQEKVIHIHPRRPAVQQVVRSSGNICLGCEYNLRENYLFCSFHCKFKHLLNKEDVDDLSKFLFDCKLLSESGSMSTDSVLDTIGSIKTSSGSTGYGGGTDGCTATTEFIVKKKKRSKVNRRPRRTSGVVSAITSVPGLMNRRKKNPNRSPFF